MDKKSSLLHNTATDLLQTLAIHNALRTTFVARTIYLFTSLESTNQTALKIAETSTASSNEIPDGTLVLADAQTQGRGRLGRRWISPPGVNLYASLILRPNIPIGDTPVTTCLAAVSAVQAVRACTHLEAVIKWPNDVLIHEKKVAGILTELGAARNQVNHLVIGIGMNVNPDIEMLPDEIRATATSLKAECGQTVNRNKLTAEFCNKFEENYTKLLEDGPAPIIMQFRSFSTTLGKRVRVTTPGRTVEGWAEEVDPHGALILRTEGQTREVVHSGDVIHLRNSQ
jgi:BirA family biotin operon repressor/biotin-[acetyl-CoA-carboxylase] ligase